MAESGKTEMVLAQRRQGAKREEANTEKGGEERWMKP